MDRVFLDANVFFSVAYGSPGLLKLWHAAAAGSCRLLTSAYAAAEARRNLDLPAQVAGRVVQGVRVVRPADYLEGAPS